MTQAFFRFSGPLHTSYGQFYVSGNDSEIAVADMTSGQANGLCGAAQPGGLILYVGTHTGESQMTFEVYAEAPELDPSWDEIVEASCIFTQAPVALTACISDSYVQLDYLGIGVFRARYCINAYGATEEGGDRELTGEQYLLQLWPEAWRVDQVIRQTSERAVWRHHDAASRMPEKPGAMQEALPDYQVGQIAAPVRPVEVAAQQSAAAPWDARFYSWGMAHYFSAANPSADGDIGPVTIGRVFGSETVTVDQSFGRVLVADIDAAAPVPGHPLAAVRGDALRAGDTLTASADKVIELRHYREPEAPVKSHAIMPFSMLPAGTDTVLGARSPYYKGSRFNDKSAKRIIAPVAAGGGVIGIGADIGRGDPLFEAGRRIGTGDIAVLAMAGVTQVEVVARPRVAVCSVNKYFNGNGDAATLADGVTPMVLALLARWGVTVDTVRQFDFADRKIDALAVAQIDAVAAEHDLTIVLGLLGELGEMRAMRGLTGEDAIMEEPVAPPQRGLDGSEHRNVGLYRPADLVRITSGAQSPPDAVKRCKLVMTLRGLPLPVFTAMYTMVKPALDGLSGVGAYSVHMASKYRFGSPPSGRDFEYEARQALLARSGNGKSRRHGVRWFSGVLAEPAPRDSMRHWLQLATLSTDSDGRMRVNMLPSEEYQVRSMIAAEAMVAIERGEGELAAGTIVQYFVLD